MSNFLGNRFSRAWKIPYTLMFLYAKAPKRTRKKLACKFWGSFKFQNPWKISYRNILLLPYWNLKPLLWFIFIFSFVETQGGTHGKIEVCKHSCNLKVSFDFSLQNIRLSTYFVTTIRLVFTTRATRTDFVFFVSIWIKCLCINKIL